MTAVICCPSVQVAKCRKSPPGNSLTIRKYARIAGATPKLTISASESSSFPISDLTCNRRAVIPSKKSKTIPTRIRIAAAVNSPYIARKIASVPEITFIQVIRLGICFLITNILIISIDISVKT